MTYADDQALLTNILTQAKSRLLLHNLQDALAST